VSAMRRGVVHVVAAVLFAAAAIVGLGFAVLGPVTLVRLFGWAALLMGVAGSALQVYTLREFHPLSYLALSRQVDDLMARASKPSPAPAVTPAYS